MSQEFDWKKFRFITEVQTALIANAINLSLNEDAKERRHIFSATGMIGTIGDAFDAAERIPEEMTAHDAACDFVFFMCENLREKNAVVPYWFARPYKST